jgi:hypothetical protein
VPTGTFSIVNDLPYRSNHSYRSNWHHYNLSLASIGVMVNWLANFLVSLLFPEIAKLLGEFTFLPFAALTFLFAVITWFILPETKGKSVEEVTRLLQ